MVTAQQKQLRIIGITIAMTFLACGCSAALGLLGILDTEIVGRLLMVPAIFIGLARFPPGVLFTISDGWPVLTWLGIAVVYLLPAAVVVWKTAPRRAS
jgi:hypothetical protein